MMHKIIELGSWTGHGFDVPVHLVKVSSRGLIGNDRADFLKVASHVFLDTIDNIKLASDEIPIHLNAIGAHEGYGFNRNGDGFDELTCKMCHPRFVKDAHYFANHKNKDPSKRYGSVKLSAYNDPMRRIELLLQGNGSKAAADRNGGLVMKSATIGKLQRGEPVPFSMACKVAHDVCINCHNKAANRSLYCTEDTCISKEGRRGFGCASGLTKVASDGFMQGVLNPDAYFIDISEVIKPADHIAWGGMADYMQKAASLGHVPGGAELAEAWSKLGADFDIMGPEETIFNQHVVALTKLARELAEIERQFESNQTERDLAFARGLAPTTQPPLDLDPLGEVGSSKMASGLAALAGQKIAVPLQDFLRLVAGGDSEKLASLSAQVPGHLPGVYQRLAGDAALDQRLRLNPFQPAPDLAPMAQRDWASKQASAYSIEPKLVQERVFRSAIHSAAPAKFVDKSAMVKTASADDPAEKVARQYAVYKLAALAEMLRDSADHGPLKRMVVCQNYVSAH